MASPFKMVQSAHDHENFPTSSLATIFLETEIKQGYMWGKTEGGADLLRGETTVIPSSMWPSMKEKE